jgi:hypothetical protein
MGGYSLAERVALLMEIIVRSDCAGTLPQGNTFQDKAILEFCPIGYCEL